MNRRAMLAAWMTAFAHSEELGGATGDFFEAVARLIRT